MKVVALFLVLHAIPSTSVSPDVSPTGGHANGSTAYSSGASTTAETTMTVTTTIRTRFFSGWDAKGESKVTRDHRTIFTLPGQRAGETETEVDESVCLFLSFFASAEIPSPALSSSNSPSPPSTRSPNSPTHPSTEAYALALRILSPFISRAGDNWHIV
jgi:hypothetical protein